MLDIYMWLGGVTQFPAIPLLSWLRQASLSFDVPLACLCYLFEGTQVTFLTWSGYLQNPLLNYSHSVSFSNVTLLYSTVTTTGIVDTTARDSRIVKSGESE